jgi:ankyrin repeat protein
MDHIIFNKYNFYKKYACSPMVNSTEFTPLCFLMLHINTYPELIKIIPNFKNDINVTNKKGWTPLALACMNDVDIECIKFLLSLGADPNITANDGYSPLMMACCFDNKSYNVVQLLLEYGAHTTFVSKEGWNAFMFACRNTDVKTVSLLINCHNINNITLIGNTPLIVAMNNEKYAIEVIKFLLDSGANLNIANKDGKTIYDSQNQDIINLVRKYDKSIYNVVYNFLCSFNSDTKQKLD